MRYSATQFVESPIRFDNKYTMVHESISNQILTKIIIRVIDNIIKIRIRIFKISISLSSVPEKLNFPQIILCILQSKKIIIQFRFFIPVYTTYHHYNNNNNKKRWNKFLNYLHQKYALLRSIVNLYKIFSQD